MALRPGHRLGTYEVIAQIGQGGMGEVYRARDVRLGRDVALKVLPAEVAGDPNRLARFEREARTVAGLNHPNIVVLYSVEDEDDIRFLTMELVEGESLDHHVVAEGLPLPRVLDLGIAIADALVAAHQKGVVHRDLKPANVMLTRDGRVKVLDFGLAKADAAGSALADPQAATVAKSAALSSEGQLMGTAPYMAPEQIRGETVDARSDLFALGIMLYELATGRRPFAGNTIADLTSAILRDIPEPLTSVRSDLSGELERIVERCLEKDPRERFQTALDVHNDLRAFRRKLDRGSSAAPSSKAAPPRASVAVLPFVNRGQSTDDEYFSDGLAEDLINALSAAGGIHVASRTSAFRFRSTTLDIRDIGSQLNVACVLEGSVRRAGSKLRVTAQLVNVTSGFQLWSERYDREMTDVFEIQDQIVSSITEALVPALTGTPRPTRRGTENIEAYELYLKGRHYWHQRSPATVRVAIQSYERAIALDENYALAYCGLADCYGILRVYGWTRREENQATAEAAVAKAMALDPALAEANFSKAFYDFYFERNWRSAGPLFAKSRELNPQSSLIQVYGGLFATMERKQEDAVRLVERSREIDPLSPFIHGLSSCAYYIMGRFSEAESSGRRALELQPDYLLGLWTHGLALCALEQFDGGIAALQRSIALSRAPFFIGACGFGLARAGREHEARQLLAELDERATRGEFVPAFARLSILVGLRDLEAVRRELVIALDEVTPPFSLWVIAGVFLDAYRTDPEVRRLLEAWYEGSHPSTFR